MAAEAAAVYMYVRGCGTTCHSTMIRELKSLDPEICDRNGQSPLHVAATMPHSSALRAMLDVFYGDTRAHEHRRFDINHVTAAGDSALHVCCMQGDAVKVRMMLERGADLEKRGSNSCTLLHRLVQVRLDRLPYYGSLRCVVNCPPPRRPCKNV